MAPAESLPVLAADTVVVCDGVILGKPSSPAQAAAMLTQLSGRTHQVVTGLCLAVGGRFQTSVDVTEVRLAPMTAEEIEWYVETGEPLDKAGAYHVDGRGALFITQVTGSPSNVAGLPIRLFLTLARAAGIDVGLPGAGA